ncbi:LCP family glycopolymer transferase, partial [Enterococcus faecalis]
VDFQSFEKIVDSMFPKGVKIDAEKSLNLDGVDIEKGQQVMDGHVLLQYARFRMDEEGDFGRVRRQQQVMSAVMSQMK